MPAGLFRHRGQPGHHFIPSYPPDAAWPTIHSWCSARRDPGRQYCPATDRASYWPPRLGRAVDQRAREAREGEGGEGQDGEGQEVHAHSQTVRLDFYVLLSLTRPSYLVAREKMLYPQKGDVPIRNSKKHTHFYKSEYHKPLPKPPAGLSPKRAALYVHHHKDGKQIWLWDEVAGDESEKGSRKYEWRRVREGISHPHPSLQGHVMHVLDDGTPRWVLARSRLRRLALKKRDLVADVALTDE